MRILTADGRWEAVNVARTWDLLSDGIPVGNGGIELTDGPGGEKRFVTYRTVYETNPWLYACVDLISRNLSRMDLKLFEDADKNNVNEPILPFSKGTPGRPSAKTRLARALRYPGTDEVPVNRRQLWHDTVVDRLVEGNALWVKRQNKDGLLGFDWMKVTDLTLDDKNRVYKPKNGGEPLLQQDLLHFGRPGAWGWRLSPIKSLKATIALYDAVERHLTAFFDNGARPSGHLKVDRTTGKAARDLIKQELTNLYAHPENAGRVMVTSGEWQSMAEAPDQSAVIDLIKLSREEIATTYGVPPPMVGILDRAIMANVQELRNFYVRDLVGPWAEKLEGDFEAQVIDVDPRLEGAIAKFDLDSQLRADLEARAATFRDQLLVYGVDELRIKEGLEPTGLPEAQAPRMPINERTLGTPQPAAPAAPPAAPAPEDNQDTPPEEDN